MYKSFACNLLMGGCSDWLLFPTRRCQMLCQERCKVWTTSTKTTRHAASNQVGMMLALKKGVLSQAKTQTAYPEGIIKPGVLSPMIARDFCSLQLLVLFQQPVQPCFLQCRRLVMLKSWGFEKNQKTRRGPLYVSILGVLLEAGI